MPPNENAPEERGWTVALREKDADTLEIAVYDIIGESFSGDGITAKDVLSMLRAAPAAKTISLRINSVGGVTDEAKAMVNLLSGRSAAGTSIEAQIDGIAASSASYLTTVANRVVMPSNAFLMLHETRCGGFGRAGDMEARAALLRKTNEHFALGYANASSRRGKKKTKEDYLAAMAKGDLYLTADEAIEWGLADEKTEPIKAVAILADIGRLENAPERLRTAPYVVTAQADPLPDPPPEPPEQPAPVPASPPPAPVAPEPPDAAATQGKTMPPDPEPTQPIAASEPASVTVSGVKLLGVTTEAEAHARINDLNKLSISLLGVTGKGSHSEALMQIAAWKTGYDQSFALAAKVTELEGATARARRDGMIEKLSREGRLAPAAHEWARTQFATAEALETFAMTLPPMAKLGPTEPIEGSASNTLTPDELHVCKLLGITENAYLEQKKLDQTTRRV